jgi:hypothetical protein
MGSTALQTPSCIAGHICLGMDQRGTVVVVTVRVRRVMAGLFVALAKERQIQSVDMTSDVKSWRKNSQSVWFMLMSSW